VTRRAARAPYTPDDDPLTLLAVLSMLVTLYPLTSTRFGL